MNKFKTSIVMLLVSMMMMVSALEAKDRSFGQIYSECGLGGMLGTEVGGQAGKAVAVISNVTWDLGTTASSSNMSSQDNCSSYDAEMASFIYNGFDSIEQDLANGSGLYIQALAKLSNQNEKDFILKARMEFSKIVASNDYLSLTRYQKAQKLYNIVY